MQRELSGFNSELRISPRPVGLALILIAAVVLFLADVPAELSSSARLLALALAIGALAAATLWLDKARPAVGRWLTVVCSVALVNLAAVWLGAPGALALAAIPTLLAAALIGLPAAAAVSAGQTVLVVLVTVRTGTRQDLLTMAAALAAVWLALLLMVAVYRPILTVGNWSWASYQQALRMLEEARSQRLELKQIQDDLIQANRELARRSERLRALHQVAEEARQAKEEFVANVSHELRTPLNMIVGYSEMIPRLSRVYGVHLPAALLSDIATIQRNAEHLSKLVDDVLDLSQVEAGRMALSKEWTSLAEVIDEAVAAVRPLFESKDLFLEAKTDATLPRVYCDATRIRQVVLNLLSNAGRFTERGGVHITAELMGNEVVTCVSDSGPGIAPADRERIFEPFQQADGSIRRQHGGSGLGLSISRRFVEMHGGRMWLESEVGVGTTFCFSLPVERPLPVALVESDDVLRWFNPDKAYEARTRRSKAPVREALPRYVLLDEGEALPRLFGRYMQDAEIVAVRSMPQAIDELSRSPAQALVVNALTTDGRIPSLESLTSLPYNTPALTCWVPGESDAARRLGVRGYLVQPVTRDALLSVLEELGAGIRTILVVDDNPEALKLVSRMISSAERGYTVLQTGSGRRALGLLRERRPDLVLLDLVMPGMDGFQVLQAKEQDPSIRDIPVVIVSAKDPSGEPIVSDALSITCSAGLSIRDLLACIRAVSAILTLGHQSAGPGRPGSSAG